MNHTPTPWTLTVQIEPDVMQIESDGHAGIIASDIRNNANAALIVRAVNSHDELLAALEAMIQRFCTVGRALKISNAETDTFDVVIQARAAIAKAKS